MQVLLQTLQTTVPLQAATTKAATSSPGAGSPKSNTACHADAKPGWRMTELA